MLVIARSKNVSTRKTSAVDSSRSLVFGDLAEGDRWFWSDLVHFTRCSEHGVTVTGGARDWLRSVVLLLVQQLP